MLSILKFGSYQDSITKKTYNIQSLNILKQGVLPITSSKPGRRAI